MATSAKKGSKPIFKTTRPYTETEWPTLSPIQKGDIMDLLCSLLQPLGHHRRTYIQPSKGKKRKRQSQSGKNKNKDTLSTSHPEEPTIPDAPPPPEIQTHILIGLNNVTRHLEALATRAAPPTAPSQSKEHVTNEVERSDTNPPRPLALVLIPHNHPPASLPHAHIPTLVHLSTLNSTREKATRLVVVPPDCESAIAEALNIPHVGALGIMEGAPGTDALVSYVREHVDVTRCAWIDEAMGAEWKATKLDMGKA